MPLECQGGLTEDERERDGEKIGSFLAFSPLQPDQLPFVLRDQALCKISLEEILHCYKRFGEAIYKST